MPLSVGLLVAPEPPAPPAPTPADLPTAVWVDPSGVRWPLTDPTRPLYGGPGWFTPAPGPTGLGVTPRSLATDRRDRGGAYVRGVRRESRTITWPLFIEGATHGEFVARWRALADAFARTADEGPGRLIFSRPDGSRRDILAFLQSGFEGEPDAGIRWDVATPTLFCPVGDWRDPTVVPITRQGSAGGRNFLKRFPRLSSSQTLGASTVTNPGTELAWPFWTVTGPATLVTAANDRRGEQWVLNPVAFRGTGLAAGEVVNVNTETGEVTGPLVGGSNDWAGAVDWTTSTLWPLDRGDSKVAFTLAGQGSATLVEASFFAYYSTP